MRINYNDTFIDVALEDDAKASFELMGDNVLQLHFKLPEWIEIPVGATIEWQGKEYIMYESMEFTKNGTRSFDYQLKFYPPEYRLKHWKMRNPIDNRLQYTMSLSPKEYVKHIVEALNKRDSGWSVGECIEAPEQVVAFDHTFIWDSLMEQAEVFNTEMEVIGKTIHLRKIEKNKDNPLPLAYGKGNGFVPGVGRKNTSDKVPFSTLYVQGGEKNINYSTYGNRFLLLPKSQSIAFDGEKFDDEEGFNRDNSRIYISSADGLSITRDGLQNNDNDDSLDLTTIYPNRLEKIIRVYVVDAKKNWYDIVIDAPHNLNYRNWQIGGETPTITFQSGMLSGKTFDLATNDNGVLICEQIKEEEVHIGWKLQIVPTEIDGLIMPGEQGYIPVVGDTLRLFGITLPQEYICDNVNKSGASWEMFREAVKYMYDNEDKKFTFTGELQPKWVRENYLNVMGYLEPGSYILFRDDQFDREGVRVRVTGVRYPLNNPYEVELTISNEVEGKTAGTTLRNLEQEKVKIPAREQNIISYTQRGFRDLKETTNMLSQAISGFDDGIKPIFVETMQTIVGDEKLQYEFTDGSYTNVVASIINYNEQKQIVMPQQYIRHRTLGITTIAPTHDYLHWEISSYTSAILSDVDKAYYLYVQASKNNTTATMYISEQPMQDTELYYYLLFAIVNKENNGTRSIVTLNSYTEILPGRITTDKIVSADGQTYFDLNGNEIGGRINFINGLISGLIILNDKDGNITAAISGEANGLPLGGNLKDFAFAAGITNAYSEDDDNPADAILVLTHDGYDSKIGLLNVEKEGITIRTKDNSRCIALTSKHYDEYINYNIFGYNDYRIIKEDNYGTMPNFAPIGDNINNGYNLSLELLFENFIRRDFNDEYFYTTKEDLTVDNYKGNGATQRRFNVEVGKIIDIRKSGEYLLNIPDFIENDISFIRQQNEAISTGRLLAYAQIVVTAKIRIEKYNILGGYINSEEITFVPQKIDLDFNNIVYEGNKVEETTSNTMPQDSINLKLNGGKSYSVTLSYNYEINYACAMQSRYEVDDILNNISLKINSKFKPGNLNMQAILKEQLLVISPYGIKLPSGEIIN